MAEPFVGEIKLFGFGFAPRGYAYCNGQIIAISQNQILFALLGTNYGGDGVRTFQLPNMQGRTPVHVGEALPGFAAGLETVALTVTQIPVHDHAVRATSATADKRPPTAHSFGTDTSTTTNFFAASQSTVALSPQSVGPAGANIPHENMQPYLVMNYCIAITGIYPSRN